MKVLVVSGIWPPDVGGPASHAPEVAAFLRARGHRVEVVTTAEAAPRPEAYPVHWVSRRRPPGVRHARAAWEVARRARPADVVYTTGMLGRSAAGARLAGRPYVVKLTADPAFERARRRGLAHGDVDAFARARGPVPAALRAARDAVLRGAAHVVCPSAWLRDRAVGWGVPADRVSVLPNPAPVAVPGEAPRAEAGRLLAFAGRLTAQKSLEVALEAVARVEGVTLVLAGDGPERAALERRASELGLRSRVRFLGAAPRDEVLALFRSADASLLSSSWENFPHGVVESLAVGTPVLATRTGGVAEVVEDGRNGLLVEPGDPEALAEAVRRFFGDAELRSRLRAAAAPSVAAYAPERVYGRLEEILAAAARGT
ncbi:MAG TPA: glycosyltransferase family 4 protein [Gaiellaceae bacterium]|nr:glycosyltransferase family 4 protein [Gaiellaceae bacterium]